MSVDVDRKGTGGPSTGGALGVRLSSDASDAPGATLDSTSYSVDVIKTLPSDPQSGLNEHLVDVAFASRPLLTAGRKYWITLTSVGDSDTCIAVATTPQTGNPPQEAFADSYGYTGPRQDPAAANHSVWKLADYIATDDGAPSANADAYATDLGKTLTVPAPGVLSNDGDPNGDALRAVRVTGPAHGVLTPKSDGSFTYSPTEDYVGMDSFSYQASDGSQRSAVTRVTLTIRAACDGLAATKVGTSGADTLAGTAGTDVIAALGGGDSIRGFAGNDRVCGGSGADTINAGSGNDVMIGGSGNDVLRGDVGNDRLFGASGNDVLEGELGHDSLFGGLGLDSLLGGGGNDQLDGGPGSPDGCDGGAGSDTATAACEQIAAVP